MTMLRLAFLIYCVVTLCVAQPQDSIDLLQPVMRTSPETGVTEDDFFGYTLVLHQTNTTGGYDNTR